eukprot:CAMPEP_0174843362 /NCGR_PEP_ID=MMETSP1114-20130205/10474_1 /TAXON_ID=312471 /ORGANISM="Neobodo designis, Strain CCAP 1951/1" /LENGTH=78 /DNA_ID=CAMNT_0016077579 /DNA_START=54 /DNA_END=287 /DNA_ORIENTATION=+
MAWLYESPYHSQRGRPEAYQQWAEEEPLRGSGRRANHWRHLDSHFSISHGHDEQVVMRNDVSPHRRLATRRREEASRN